MGSGREIKQVYTPYYEWEDFLNGMWRSLPKEDEEAALIKAIEYTGDHIKYGAAMGLVMELWPRTMINSMTNSGINRRAFLGHCAVQLAINVPEYITRQAWGLLTEQQRVSADQQAQNNIDVWIKEYAEKN